MAHVHQIIDICGAQLCSWYTGVYLFWVLGQHGANDRIIRIYSKQIYIMYLQTKIMIQHVLHTWSDDIMHLAACVMLFTEFHGASSGKSFTDNQMAFEWIQQGEVIYDKDGNMSVCILVWKSVTVHDIFIISNSIWEFACNLKLSIPLYTAWYIGTVYVCSYVRTCITCVRLNKVQLTMFNIV